MKSELEQLLAPARSNSETQTEYRTRQKASKTAVDRHLKSGTVLYDVTENKNRPYRKEV